MIRAFIFVVLAGYLLFTLSKQIKNIQRLDLFYKLCQIALTISVVLLAYQIYADHKARKKEAAINVMHQWMQAGTRVRSMRNLINYLPEDHISSIVNNPETVKDTTFKRGFEGDVKVCLSLEEKNNEKTDFYTIDNKCNAIKLTSYGTEEFRLNIVNVFNELEMVFASWEHDVADRDMITEQFKPFFEEDNHLLITAFRKIDGNEKAYPCTTNFIGHLETTRQPGSMLNGMRSWW